MSDQVQEAVHVATGKYCAQEAQPAPLTVSDAVKVISKSACAR